MGMCKLINLKKNVKVLKNGALKQSSMNKSTLKFSLKFVNYLIFYIYLFCRGWGDIGIEEKKRILHCIGGTYCYNYAKITSK